ncbi:MAG: hypothetical protein RLO50_02005 [Azospirillaceae bacterium]
MAGKTVTVRVPMAFTRRGGRKVVVVPDGADAWAPAPRVDGTLVRALARAHRWQRMLDEGKFATIGEMAKTEGVSAAYISRVLRLNLLAPDIVEATLDGTRTLETTTGVMAVKLPQEWSRQRRTLVTDLLPQGSSCDLLP